MMGLGLGFLGGRSARRPSPFILEEMVTMLSRLFPVLLLALATAGPTGAAEHYFDSDGVKIRYVTEGKGETVVLVHGFAASAELNWILPKVMAELAMEFRVVALDCRGHGKSGKPRDPKAYGPEMTRDVVRLLDHLKVKKAHVVGYSMGAGIAGDLLVRYPDRLLSVTFGGGGPWIRVNKDALAVVEATAASLENGKGLTPLLIALSPPGKAKPTEEAARAVSDLVLQGQDPKALAAVLRAERALVTEAQLKMNKVPVTFIYGDKESGWIKDVIATARKALPGSGVKEIEGGDHIGTISRPEFRKAILESLREQKK
jgi:pimeloyl-ACP methyl ester carboxylesterase